MPRQATVTTIDPDDQQAMLHSLSRVHTRAGVRNFCAILWEYLGSNYQTQAAFQAFVNRLSDTISVQQINIGTNMRIRAIPNGAVIEVLGADKDWHIHQTFTTP